MSSLENLIGCVVLSKWKDNRKFYKGILLEISNNFGLIKYENKLLNKEYVPLHYIKPYIEDNNQLYNNCYSNKEGLISCDFNMNLFMEYVNEVIINLDKSLKLCELEYYHYELLKRHQGNPIFSTTNGIKLLSHHQYNVNNNNNQITYKKIYKTSYDKFQLNKNKISQDCVYFIKNNLIYLITTSSTIILSSNWSEFKKCFINNISFENWKIINNKLYNNNNYHLINH